MATLLPEERRERFFLAVAKFRRAPEDDEFLQILEAVGFLALALHEIPQEIARSLDKLQGGLSEHQREDLRQDVEEVLKASLDTPSYKDLRGLVQEMRTCQQQFRGQVENLGQQLPKNTAPRYISVKPGIVVWLVLAATAVICGVWILRPNSATECIQYHTTRTQKHGTVGVYLFPSQVISATHRDDKGIVVVKLPPKP